MLTFANLPHLTFWNHSGPSQQGNLPSTGAFPSSNASSRVLLSASAPANKRTHLGCSTIIWGSNTITQTLIASECTLKMTAKVMLKHSDWWVPYDNETGKCDTFPTWQLFRIWVTMVLEVRLQLTSQHDSAMPGETQLELEKGVAQTTPNQVWLWLIQMVNKLYEISCIIFGNTYMNM